MQRHSEELHNVIIPNPNEMTNSPRVPQGGEESHSLPKHAEFSVDRILRPIVEVMKISNDYSKSIAFSPNSDYLNNTVTSLQEQLTLHKRQIEDISSNHWILPNKEIEGVTAYVCRRCLTINFRPTRDIGFDRTAQAKHKCDENKVRQLFMVACREIDHWNNDNFVAGELLKYIHFLFKGNRFLLASDISGWFETLKNIRDLKTVYEFLGIPERYPFCVLPKDHNVGWLHRAINNLNTKIILTDDELMDFLRRLKSTYGVIETYDGPILTRILVRIVP